MRLRIEQAIRAIPRGKVSTYGGVARAAGFPGAARQVAAALRRGFGLPWQRVLGAGGADQADRGLGDRATSATGGRGRAVSRAEGGYEGARVEGAAIESDGHSSNKKLRKILAETQS